MELEQTSLAGGETPIFDSIVRRLQNPEYHKNLPTPEDLALWMSEPNIEELKLLHAACGPEFMLKCYLHTTYVELRLVFKLMRPFDWWERHLVARYLKTVSGVVWTQILVGDNREDEHLEEYFFGQLDFDIIWMMNKSRQEIRSSMITFANFRKDFKYFTRVYRQ